MTQATPERRCATAYSCHPNPLSNCMASIDSVGHQAHRMRRLLTPQLKVRLRRLMLSGPRPSSVIAFDNPSQQCRNGRQSPCGLAIGSLTIWWTSRYLRFIAQEHRRGLNAKDFLNTPSGEPWISLGGSPLLTRIGASQNHWTHSHKCRSNCGPPAIAIFMREPRKFLLETGRTSISY